jgi:hypothetical protein
MSGAPPCLAVVRAGSAGQPTRSVVRRLTTIWILDVRSSEPLKFRLAVRRIARLSVAALTTLFQPTVSDLETAHSSSIRARACYPNGHVHTSELVVSSQRAPRAGVRACKRLFRCLTLSGIRGGLAFDRIWTSKFQSKPVWRQPSLRLVEALP